jgi:hypothetical protein
MLVDGGSALCTCKKKCFSCSPERGPTELTGNPVETLELLLIMWHFSVPKISHGSFCCEALLLIKILVAFYSQLADLLMYLGFILRLFTRDRLMLVR